MTSLPVWGWWCWHVVAPFKQKNNDRCILATHPPQACTLAGPPTSGTVPPPPRSPSSQNLPCASLIQLVHGRLPIDTLGAMLEIAVYGPALPVANMKLTTLKPIYICRAPWEKLVVMQVTCSLNTMELMWVTLDKSLPLDINCLAWMMWSLNTIHKEGGKHCKQICHLLKWCLDFRTLYNSPFL